MSRSNNTNATRNVKILLTTITIIKVTLKMKMIILMNLRIDSQTMKLIINSKIKIVKINLIITMKNSDIAVNFEESSIDIGNRKQQ